MRTAACLGFLFLLNVYVCHNLFHTEFIQETASVDVIFMAFSRWLANHWTDRSWFPMWVMGTPAREVYNPLLHHGVAFLARITGWTAQHAYHFVTASTYSLGPLTLFWLCYQFTRRHGYALLTALIYSLFSPSVLLVAALRVDNGGLFGPRRFQTLVHYGEGPHVTALMLIPLVLWLLDEAASKRRWMFLPLATIAVACVPLTNWTGTTGLMMALPAYVLAKFGSDRPIHWPTLIGIGALAYALASYWIPPSLIRTVQASAVNLDIVTPPLEKAAILAFLAVAVMTLHILFQRRQAPVIFRFFTYFALISGTAVLAKMWFGRVIVPIAHRFHLEMEMGIAGAAAFLILAITKSWPRRYQIAALVLLIAAAIPQARYYRRESRNTTKATDISDIPEVRMSKWFAANAHGERVLAPGTVALWLNHYSETPQFFGCCDQTARNEEFRGALFNIYYGDPVGGHGSIATAWLKAYGVSYIGVADTGGDQPYGNVHKFEGILDEVWRDGNSVVYRAPRPNASLAHVVPSAALQIRRIDGGYDIEPLRPLLAALDQPPSLATFRWVNQHEAEIAARTENGQSIFIQETCDPGWRAYEGATERPVSCGPLGLTVVDPQYAGQHNIRLIYAGSVEDRMARVAQLGGVALLIVWTLRMRRYTGIPTRHNP